MGCGCKGGSKSKEKEIFEKKDITFSFIINKILAVTAIVIILTILMVPMILFIWYSGITSALKMENDLIKRLINTFKREKPCEDDLIVMEPSIE